MKSERECRAETPWTHSRASNFHKSIPFCLIRHAIIEEKTRVPSGSVRFAIGADSTNIVYLHFWRIDASIIESIPAYWDLLVLRRLIVLLLDVVILLLVHHDGRR